MKFEHGVTHCITLVDRIIDKRVAQLQELEKQLYALKTAKSVIDEQQAQIDALATAPAETPRARQTPASQTEPG